MHGVNRRPHVIPPDQLNILECRVPFACCDLAVWPHLAGLFRVASADLLHNVHDM